VAPVIVIVVPRAPVATVDDDIGAQATIEIGGQYAGLNPAASRIIVVITSPRIVVNANGGVVPVVIGDSSRPRIIGHPLHRAACKGKDHRQDQ
jgi:hypothetical protein